MVPARTPAPYIASRTAASHAISTRAQLTSQIQSTSSLLAVAHERGQTALVLQLARELQRLGIALEGAQIAEQAAMEAVRVSGGTSVRPRRLKSPTRIPPSLFPAAAVPIPVTELPYVPKHTIKRSLGIVYASASNRDGVRNSLTQLQKIKERLRAEAKIKGSHAVVDVQLSYDDQLNIAASGHAVLIAPT